MKAKFFTLTTLVLLSLSACKKPTSKPSAAEADIQKPMLKTIYWPLLGVTAVITYNADNTAKNISYTGIRIPSRLEFSYSRFGLSNVELTNSLDGKFLFYDALTGRLTEMTKAIKEGGGYRNYAKATFNNSVSGRLEVLRHYIVNEAGSKLSYTSTYEYNANGLPKKITVIDKNNNKRVIVLEEYSDEVLFDPLYFIDFDMGELFHVYNNSTLELLSKLHRLPSRLKITEYRGSQVSQEKLVETNFTISSKKLVKQIIKVTGSEFPTPQYEELHYGY
ncbi:hypothetical protein [Pedobacter sp. ASV28]|uniref:hypothetical protein n=1 Tax=Pedobacter sp. ASV28 TaxID=2795123 RepID=UPI0018EDE9E2|nr:hypothetical protein [Pedobacter sp. ASV28]